MAKTRTEYVCQSCGATALKWSGKCESCHSWNTMVEEITEGSSPLRTLRGHTIDFLSLQDNAQPVPRRLTGIGEFDRVCGGGLVAGSVLLVGGDPGIGKSTLLLQVAASLSQNGRCAYISGEEAADQIRLRAQRLNVAYSPIELATSTSVADIISTLKQKNSPQVVIIDSIQTMALETLDSAPGTVSQIRATTHELIRLAKQKNITVIIVGHVTKEGVIAGPKVLEHMVDTVLYFEGERGHQFRILRSVKNRFGATDEIGVFEMSDGGLKEIPNPSALFLTQRAEAVSGASVFAGIEGTRPLLVEIQTLIAPSGFASPRRAVVGWDVARLSMVIAVLEARCGLNLGNKDIYLNIVGGLKISEPAADLAVAAALLSSLTNIPIPGDTVIFGEIGLSGEIRPVSQQNARIKESIKLGYKSGFIPFITKDKNKSESFDSVVQLNHISQLVERFDIPKLKHERE